MRAFFAFFKKEWLDWLRSGKFAILFCVFLILGIMNPAIAKLTPWLMEIMAESLEETGLIVSNVEVNALSSWIQFFKNVPMGLILFVFVCSSSFSKEYQSGTLILLLTKGLKRSMVVITKTTLLILTWSVLFWFCYGVTYLYNSYFWDNSIVVHLMLAVGCWWLFGIWVISLMIFFSVVLKSNTGVLSAVGVVIFCMYLLGMTPKIGKYIPTKLMNASSILTSMEGTSAYQNTIVITIVLIIVFIFISIPVINKKQI